MSSAAMSSIVPTQPWRLPPTGLALFEGDSDAPRMSRYFLPSLALNGRRILFHDGASMPGLHGCSREPIGRTCHTLFRGTEREIFVRLIYAAGSVL